MTITKFCAGESRWREEKRLYDTRIGTLEAYTESLPAVLILTAVWVADTEIRDNNDWDTEGGKSSWSNIIWLSAYVSSILTASFGMIKFFKHGPVEFLAGYLTLKSFLVYFSVLFMLVSKGGLLAFMIRDRPSLKYFYSAQSYEPSIGHSCPQLTLLYHDHSFRNKLFNLTESSMWADIFSSDEIPQNILIWNRTLESWLEKRNKQNVTKLSGFKTPVCGDWENDSLVLMDSLLWFLLTCAPAITLEALFLIKKLGYQKFIRLLSNAPQVFLSPGFSPFGFQKTVHDNLALSPSISCGTCMITLVGYFLSGLVTWDTVQDYPNSLKDHRLWMQLMPILFLLSCILSMLVMFLPCIQDKEPLSEQKEDSGIHESTLKELKIRSKVRRRSI